MRWSWQPKWQWIESVWGFFFFFLWLTRRSVCSSVILHGLRYWWLQISRFTLDCQCRASCAENQSCEQVVGLPHSGSACKWTQENTTPCSSCSTIEAPGSELLMTTRSSCQCNQLPKRKKRRLGLSDFVRSYCAVVMASADEILQMFLCSQRVVLYFVWEKKRERNGSWRDGHTAVECTYNSCVHINVPVLAFTLFGFWDACVASQGTRWHLGVIKKKGQMCKFWFSLRPKCIIFPKTVGKQWEIYCVVAMYKTVC